MTAIARRPSHALAEQEGRHLVPCPGSLAGANFALCLGVAVPWPLSASMSRAVSDPCDHLPPWRSGRAGVANTPERTLPEGPRAGG